MSRLLFLHGAGGFDDDRVLAKEIAEALGADLVMPRLPDSDMSFQAWAAPIRSALADLGPSDALVAHSFGASILLQVLAEQDWGVPAATVLGMPDWSRAGWDVADYAYAGPEPTNALSLHHCRDDEVVPFDHLALHAARLPSAQVHEHPVGGHQFEGLARVIAGA